MTRTQKRRARALDAFDLAPGRVLVRKYSVLERIGVGWESEVYRVRETATGVERAAKFFYPRRNPRDRAVKYHARKLHKLRHCPILIQYHTQETMRFRGLDVTFLVSEYVEGELLSHFLGRQPGRRIAAFQALHLLHALAVGIECIHRRREYHGDLHTSNVIVRRCGLGFDLKLIDFFRWDDTRTANIEEDVCNLVRILYDAVGGPRHYARQPDAVKQIVCGLKRTLILKKFRTAGQLRRRLESLEWD